VRRWTWPALAALALFVCAAGRLAAQEDDAGIAIGRTPPAVTLEDLQGRAVDLAALIGSKPALIEFWATWCPRCRELEPRLRAAHARYGARVQFVAVAVAVNETADAVRRHLASDSTPYPFVWDGNGNAVRAFQAPATSYVVVLDKTRKVVYTGVGPEQNIDSVLARVTRPS
jgi:thiol-disulfide isomerase/thioredoxin